MSTHTRHFMLLAALIAALAAQVAAEPPVVARVKVHNPAATELKDFVVRGALPLPADYDKPPAGLALRDAGKLLPTQVSVFATYPGSDAAHPVGRPEVVQLAARCSLPPGAFKQLDVVQLAAAPQAARAAPGKALATWLAGKAPLLVEADDCFGNRYRAEPLQAGCLIETRQAGSVLIERVYQAVLTPVGAAKADKPALKRLLRVRAYLTVYAGEEFASLALMIHNGSIDHPNGTVYYRSLRAGVAEPMGLAVWQKPFSPAAGAGLEVRDGYSWQPCPAPAAGGKVFVMPARAAALLRTVVYAPPAKARATSFGAHGPLFVPVASQKLFSWSNFATARYGANNYPMPFSLSAERIARFRNRLPQRRRRPWRRLGHALPAGVRYGGMTGGEGIFYVYGIEAAVTGDNGLLQAHVLLADRHWDRHRAHRFYDDGRPYTHSRHVVEVAGRKLLDVPLDRRGWPIEPVADPACKAHARHVRDGGLLAAEAAELLRYMNHDDQHLSRVFDAVPAAYLACDPVNRDRLVTLGAQACATLNVHPYRGKPNWGGFGSLVQAGKAVDARPHRGVAFGRANGWLNQALCYAFYLSRDKRLRQDCIDVAKADAEIRRKAQMPAGNVTVHRPYSKVWNGQYEYVNAWQSVGVMGDGARCLAGILSAPETRRHAEMLKQMYARVGKWSITTGWESSKHMPAGNVGLRKKGEKEYLEKPYVPPSKGGGSNYYFGSPYVWFYEITGDKQFLDRLAEMTRKDLKGFATRNLPNWSYCLWLAQGGRIPDRKGL